MSQIMKSQLGEPRRFAHAIPRPLKEYPIPIWITVFHPAHESVLERTEGIEEFVVTFGGSVWKLVEWLETSEVGQSLDLNLDVRPH